MVEICLLRGQDEYLFAWQRLIQMAIAIKKAPFHLEPPCSSDGANLIVRAFCWLRRLALSCKKCHPHERDSEVGDSDYPMEKLLTGLYPSLPV